LGNLCDNFGKIARKNARLRDTSDQMVSTLNEYSGKEKINTSTKKGLVNYSSFLSAVEDYRNAMVYFSEIRIIIFFLLLYIIFLFLIKIERVEKKIIQPLSKYQEYLKSSRVN
jgi:hypothetical protein